MTGVDIDPSVMTAYDLVKIRAVSTGQPERERNQPITTNRIASVVE